MSNGNECMIDKNIDDSTVAGFGDEWERFDQSPLLPEERQKIFDSYFSVFPWKKLTIDSVGFDLGCGSGRYGFIFKTFKIVFANM